MVSVFASSVVDRVVGRVKPKTIKFGICCFSAKHTALRSKSKDWLAQNQNNVFKWSDMSTHGLLFQHYKNFNSVCWSRTSGPHHHLIEN